MPLTDTLLNGSLWLGDNPPIWRGLPDSNETNKAWDSFEHVKPIALTKGQITAMGKDPATVAKFNDEYWGLGDDAYVGAFDFFHQVHCLSVLRREAFRYWSREGETVPKWNKIHWIHIQHCVGMMMEHLLCNADAGFLTYNWVEYGLHLSPDMSGEFTFFFQSFMSRNLETGVLWLRIGRVLLNKLSPLTYHIKVRKQCRDWRQLVDYRDAHGVNLTKYVEWTKPEGVTELEQPLDWWEHRGQGDKAYYADGTASKD
ncbi:hypothetical protein F4814DRAFT_421703 [Daldinia grandis]|nr:hypothetical protein F4814DRAFT_421703 [Daldinia grandis]